MEDGTSTSQVVTLSTRRRRRVTLVNPPSVSHPESVQTYTPGPPLGLAYLAAAVRSAGHDVCVVDAPGEAIEQRREFTSPIGPMIRTGLDDHEIVARIDPEADVIGIGNMFIHEWPTIRTLAEAIRERFPTALLVLGGETPTAFWPWILDECPAVDLCVLGEGEGTFTEVLDLLEDLDAARALEGVASRGPDGRPRSGGLRARIRGVDELAVPAWDLFPLTSYWSIGTGLALERGRSIPMLLSRGCPYKCSFCSSPQMWTTRYVTREPELICDEIESYVRAYGVQNVIFNDLTAITKRQWTMRFCDELDARGLRISWQMPAGTRSEALTRPVLERMAATGCALVTYAPESGSKRLLETMDKRADIEWILTSAVDAVDLGISTSISIVLGHPDERGRDVLATLGLIVRAALVGIHDCGVALFSPYPGSRDFEELRASGRLVIDDRYPYVGVVRGTRGGNRQRLPRYGAYGRASVQFGLMAVFYAVSFLRRPGRIWHIRQALRTGKGDTRIEALLLRRRSDRERSEATAALRQPA